MLDRRPTADAPPPRYAYTLVEVLGDGSHLRDIFGAADNAQAIARARGVIEGREAELWRGARLVCRWPQRAHAPVHG